MLWKPLREKDRVSPLIRRCPFTAVTDRTSGQYRIGEDKSDLGKLSFDCVGAYIILFDLSWE